MFSFVILLQILLILHHGNVLAEEANDTSPIDTQPAEPTNKTVILSSPGDYYVSMPDVSSLFVWVIKGSSLDGVKLDCGGAGDVLNGNKTTDIPPRAKLTLTLQNEDNVTCTVKDGEEVLETHHITRTSG